VGGAYSDSDASSGSVSDADPDIASGSVSYPDADTSFRIADSEADKGTDPDRYAERAEKGQFR